MFSFVTLKNSTHNRRNASCFLLITKLLNVFFCIINKKIMETTQKRNRTDEYIAIWIRANGPVRDQYWV